MNQHVPKFMRKTACGGRRSRLDQFRLQQSRVFIRLLEWEFSGGTETRSAGLRVHRPEQHAMDMAPLTCPAPSTCRPACPPPPRGRRPIGSVAPPQAWSGLRRLQLATCDSSLGMGFASHTDDSLRLLRLVTAGRPAPRHCHRHGPAAAAQDAHVDLG
jgi:hypothetical protein